MVTTKPITAEELERFQPEDEYRYELIHGTLYRMPPSSFLHGLVLGQLALPLALFVDEHELGDVLLGGTGFVLDRKPDTVLAPDLAFVRRDRTPPKGERDGFGWFAPDLVVEVTAPTDWPEKVTIYLEAGVPLVWLCDPEREVVQVHAAGQRPATFAKDQVLSGGAVLPGFRLRLEDVFE